ncbi:PREDICTED: odorant receptor 49a-like [Wasmannia auropunctata]|uniref:odorant receptor 49a-like n=1 Tax=Wasmannia auropunctata TaxID=64793 RepID=UPI0005EF2ECC|nr:PREDICTED: odorant receptor 49a-like [Wasmannia auropunctata]
MMSTIETMVFFFTGCVIACFSLNLFQLFQTVSSENNIIPFVLPFIYATVSITYMFLANYIGQLIIDHNNDIFVTAYNVQWYRTPLHIQRMIIFLLQRRAKEFSLNIGGLYDASMECFATLVKLSVSYFTVIYSTR